MTPPDINLKKQRRRHWPVIWGIAGTLVLAILAWVVLSGLTEEDVNEPTPVSDTTVPSADETDETGDTD